MYLLKRSLVLTRSHDTYIRRIIDRLQKVSKRFGDILNLDVDVLIERRVAFRRLTELRDVLVTVVLSRPR